MENDPEYEWADNMLNMIRRGEPLEEVKPEPRVRAIHEVVLMAESSTMPANAMLHMLRNQRLPIPFHDINKDNRRVGDITRLWMAMRGRTLVLMGRVESGGR